MEGQFDAVILQKLGVDNATATLFIKKCQAFLDTLSPAEHDFIQRGQPTWEEAAKAIDPDMNAQDLQSFVIARGLTPPAHAFMCVGLGRFDFPPGGRFNK